MLFTVLLELELPSTSPPPAPPPSLSIQFLFHVSDVVQTKNLKQLKVGQNAPQNLVKISGHPPNIHAFATSLPEVCYISKPYCTPSWIYG